MPNRIVRMSSILTFVSLATACGPESTHPVVDGSSDSGHDAATNSDGSSDANTNLTDAGSDVSATDVATGVDASADDVASEDVASPVDAGANDVIDPVDAAPADAGCPLGTCPLCPAGYQDADGNGTCELSCAATGADAFSCGPGGHCIESAMTGLRACQCSTGYTGAMCDTCTPGYTLDRGMCVLNLPNTTNLSLWLDASEAGSMTVSSGHVSAWRDRRPAGSPSLAQSVASARPGYVAAGRSGLGVVRFDGDDQLFTSGFWGLSTGDYEIIVAALPVGGSTNGIVSIVSGTSDWAVMLDGIGSSYRLTHRPMLGTTGGTTSTVMRTAAMGSGWVAATLQTSGPLDTMALFASDGASSATMVTPVTTTEVGSAQTLRVGRTQDGFMAGDIYEVLIYTRRLSVSERAEVTDYLRAKWYLR